MILVASTPVATAVSAWARATPDNMLGYAMAGIQCEGIMTGYWMGDPDTTEFPGAINKVEGEDNGQAAYGMFDLLAAYATLDFDAIRSKVLSR